MFRSFEAMSQIANTPEARRKELQIQELEKAIKKKRTTVKRLRTRLDNLKTDIRDMNRKAGSVMMSFLEKMMKTQQELAEALKKLQESKKVKLTREQRQVVQDMLGDLGEIQAELNQDEDPVEDSQFDFQAEQGEEEEEEEAHSSDIFAEFKPELDKEEKREIRKVYLKLSQAFHPDMATNDQEREVFHRRMQQITAAYQRHDIEALLEMEQSLLADRFEDDPEQAGGTNRLDEQIARLQRELDFLDGQASRLSQEIKNIRQSDAGQALTDYDRAEREGYGLDTQQQMQEEALQSAQELREMVEQALKTGRISPELAEQLTPAPTLEDVLEQVFGGGLGWDDDEDWDDEDDDDAPFHWHPSGAQVGQHIPQDTLVTIKREKGAGLPPYFPPTGSQGIVLPPEIGQPPYLVNLVMEPAYYERLSPEAWEYFIDAVSDHPLLTVTADIVETHPDQRPPFRIQDSLKAGRKGMYEAWLDLYDFSADFIAWVRQVFLKHPGMADHEALNAHLRTIKWPGKGVEAVVRPDNPESHLRPGQRGTITEVLHTGMNEGVLVGFKIGRKRPIPFPLVWLEIEAGPPEIQTFAQHYRLWAEFRLPDMFESDEDEFPY